MPYTYERDDDGDMHVIPLNETDNGEVEYQEGHAADVECSCGPEVEHDEKTDTYIIIHNYFQ